MNYVYMGRVSSKDSRPGSCIPKYPAGLRPRQRAAAGFTLVELMVTIVILGILVSIAIPNFLGAGERAKAASVKANVHNFHQLIEASQIDTGNYPVYVQDLADENFRRSLPELANPFYQGSGQSGIPAGYTGLVNHLIAGSPDTRQASRIFYSVDTLNSYLYLRDHGATQPAHAGAVVYFAMAADHSWAGSSTWNPATAKDPVVAYGLFGFDGQGKIMRDTLVENGEPLTMPE